MNNDEEKENKNKQKDAASADENRVKQSEKAAQNEEKETGNDEGATQDGVKENGDANNKNKEKKEPTYTEKIQEMGENLAAMNDKYVRLYSEYENYRKRTNTEKADLLLNGGKEVLKAILPVVDDMERALANIPDDNIAKEGVTLVYNKLMAMLAQNGVKAITAKGQTFDENQHEAVSRIPASDETQKGIVIDVVQTGYMLNDKVLRFPKVVVAI
ncbi:MAG: nucleotide exchange factor GrpE [Bacteroidales bacterium]|nr:nucleotide exchange factor GrpE [Bacteroidales bacterium]